MIPTSRSTRFSLRRPHVVLLAVAFGITTGILLLIGLALLEKNKPKLQAYAATLATWEA